MKTKRLVQYAVYLAILTFMAWVPQVGFISVSGIRFTTMLIPIVIASVHLGFAGAIFSTTTFGFWSYITGMSINPSVVYVVEGAGLWFVNSVITRMMVGILLGLTVVGIKKLFEKNVSKGNNIFKRYVFCSLLCTAIVGQLFNTIFFVGGYMIIESKTFDIVIGLITLNLLIEWIIVIIIPVTLTPLLEHTIKKDKEATTW